MNTILVGAGWGAFLRPAIAAAVWLAIAVPAQAQTNVISVPSLKPNVQVPPPKVQPNAPVRPPVIVAPRVHVNPVQPDRLRKKPSQETSPSRTPQTTNRPHSARSALSVRTPPLPRPRPVFGPAPVLPRPKPANAQRTAAAPPEVSGPYEPDILLVAYPSGSDHDAVEQLAGRRGLAVESRTQIALLEIDLYRLRIIRGASVPGRLGEPPIPGAIAVQPNYRFDLQDAEAAKALQYVPVRLRIGEAHETATGRGVLIAVIDSGIDAAHPDLAQAVIEEFDAIGGDVEPEFLEHGTAMAGAISASSKLVGIAPGARLLSARAFSPADGQGAATGTTYAILQCLDWTYQKRTHIINMSFAGPEDPLLIQALDVLESKGALMIAAAGNAGPKAPPAYPAAHPGVVAVTATDQKDERYSSGNVGDYIAVAAPGVQVLTTVPGGFDITTGTSIAAAHVSGVAALLLERQPYLPAKRLMAILQETALDLGTSGIDREFGAGLVQPFEALHQAAKQAVSSGVFQHITGEDAAASR